MWTALSLLVLTASAAAPAPELAPGTKVRLSAGPAVEVPGLYSGDADQARYSGSLREEEGLLVFAGADEESILAPGAQVTGTFVGSQGPWIEVLRDGRETPDRVRRESVARVEVAAPRRPGRGALKGLGIGAGAGLGLGLVTMGAYSGGDGDASATIQGLAVSAVLLGSAVGLALGTLDDVFGEEGWREVPLESLGGPAGAESSTPAAAGNEGPGSWTLVSVGSGGDIAVGLVRVGPLRSAVAGLGRLERAEAGEGWED